MAGRGRNGGACVAGRGQNEGARRRAARTRHACAQHSPGGPRGGRVRQRPRGARTVAVRRARSAGRLAARGAACAGIRARRRRPGSYAGRRGPCRARRARLARNGPFHNCTCGGRLRCQPRVVWHRPGTAGRGCAPHSRPARRARRARRGRWAVAGRRAQCSARSARLAGGGMARACPGAGKQRGAVGRHVHCCSAVRPRRRACRWRRAGGAAVGRGGRSGRRARQRRVRRVCLRGAAGGRAASCSAGWRGCMRGPHGEPAGQRVPGGARARAAGARARRLPGRVVPVQRAAAPGACQARAPPGPHQAQSSAIRQ